ncbi:hypothetical protein [Streptomyces sp. NPDC058542]|uniref:hypothetical protein n=1 Tax=Streptomyces sp. NPDC058542 TaxID=3346543 RepID=UPI003650D71B
MSDLTPADHHLWQLDAVNVLELILRTEARKADVLPPLAWRLPGGRELIGEPHPGTDQERADAVRAWGRSLGAPVKVRDQGDMERHTMTCPVAANAHHMVEITVTATVAAGILTDGAGR